jgi:gluconokinase
VSGCDDGGRQPVTAVVVMGVSGCGKSTVGQALARELGWQFADADDHHPAANVARMKAGTPLDDDDRMPWLDRLRDLLRDAQQQQRPVVLACSALRQRYRERLSRGLQPPPCFVFLSGSEALIGERLAARSHRYMPASLLRSQFEALEPPADAIVVDIADPVDALVARIVAALREPAPVAAAPAAPAPPGAR